MHDDYDTNGYERTEELVLAETQLDFNGYFIDNQRSILAWCKNSLTIFPLRQDNADKYPDTVKFINETADKAVDELNRLTLERKSLLLKLEAVKAHALQARNPLQKIKPTSYLNA